MTSDQNSLALRCWKRMRPALALSLFALPALASAQALGPVTTTVLRDFEDNTVGGFASVTTANSAVSTNANDTLTNVSDAGSRRLRLDNGAPLTKNGAVVTIAGAIPGPGNWLITADVKVVNGDTSPQTDSIDSYGMAVKLGNPSTAKVSDANAGYVMNLPENFANSTALGYQTIGARIEAPASGSYPQDLTLYLGTDASRAAVTGVPANDGNFDGSHRTTANNWQSSSNHVLVDNIKRIGPGRLSEDRHMWISIGDGALTNQASMEAYLVAAKANNFTAVDILARYRANRYYRANRDFNTYTNNEPAASGSVDTTFDPLQYAIDRGKELGLKVYASVSVFIVTDGSNTYPAHMNSAWRTSVYNGGTPAVQTTSNGDPEGLWVDPGVPALRDYTKTVVMDLVQNYDLDGVIFDRIRYSDNNHGYNPLAMAEYNTLYGITGTPTPSNEPMREARRRAVTAFLQETYTSVTALKPWMVVGTVPIAYADDLGSTYNGVFQAYYQWNTAKGGSRTISFGSQDLTQPQFYRLWDTTAPFQGPGANETLMGMMVGGDVVTTTRDYGASPGALTNVAPLLYWESFDDATDANNTAATIAQNVCDSRNVLGLGTSLQGWGTFSADEAFNTKFTGTGVGRLRAATPDCGTDVLSAASEGSDFLMKAGYDRTPPTTVTGFAVQNINPIAVTLGWSAPASAADGESASRYLIFRGTAANVRPIRANQVSVAAPITGNSYTDSTFSTGGPYYYKIVPVDDYNNWGPASEIGPVNPPVGGNVVVQSRPTSGTGKTAAPEYRELGSWFDTTAKSSATNPGLHTNGSRYATSTGTSATLSPNLIYGGYYDVYVTLDDSVSGPSNNASVNWAITNLGPNVTGTLTMAPTTPGLANSWLKLASDVPLPAGQNYGITFSAIGTPTNRFCVDAVWFQLVSTGMSPLPVAVTDFAVE